MVGSSAVKETIQYLLEDWVTDMGLMSDAGVSDQPLPLHSDGVCDRGGPR